MLNGNQEKSTDSSRQLTFFFSRFHLHGFEDDELSVWWKI